MPTPAQTACQLPWLCPNSTTLLALLRLPSPEVAAALRHDPAALLLFASITDAESLRAKLVQVADRLQDTPSGRLDSSHPAVHSILTAALDMARTAESIALAHRPELAETAANIALLAPLGWLAIAATDPDAIDRCRQDSEYATAPHRAQLRHWGMDAGAIARRLLRRWLLPRGWAEILTHIGLPSSTAQHFGAPATLFAIVQLAVASVDTQSHGLMLTPGIDVTEAMHRLGLSHETMPQFDALPSPVQFDDPYQHAWMVNTLKQGMPPVDDAEVLQQEIDCLHRVIVEQAGEAEVRLRDAKLRALVEFAAGASHEINNPLAVISGQAQYLLAREEEPIKQATLQTIIRQTHRIHAILAELMQFARPSAMQRQPVVISEEIDQVLHDLAGSLAAKQLHVEWNPSDSAPTLQADPRHMQTAIGCLIRNAIEASPVEGCISIHLQQPDIARLEIIIEDEGTGIGSEERQLMFDPFYSGRAAGRGRGLGLPTAWRLAQEQGGTVDYRPTASGRTRFVLTLPTTGCCEEERHAA